MPFEPFEKKLLKSTEDYIRSYFENEGSGHDWWHIHRVRNMALRIAEKEGGNLFLIEMSALLHDLDDWKLNSGNESKTAEWLKNINANNLQTESILEIIEQVSFKGAGVENKALQLKPELFRMPTGLMPLVLSGLRVLLLTADTNRARFITPAFNL